MKHSVVKHSNVKSSSHSLVAAPMKKIRQSAGSTEIENVAMDFLFCIFSSLHIAASRLSMVKFVLCRKTGIIFIEHLSHPVTMCHITTGCGRE